MTRAAQSPAGMTPLKRKNAPFHKSLNSCLLRSRLGMTLGIAHRNLFKGPIWDRRKGIACPSKHLVLAVDAPDGSICARRYILQFSRDLSPTISRPRKDLVLGIDAPDITGAFLG